MGYVRRVNRGVVVLLPCACGALVDLAAGVLRYIPMKNVFKLRGECHSKAVIGPGPGGL